MAMPRASPSENPPEGEDVGYRVFPRRIDDSDTAALVSPVWRVAPAATQHLRPPSFARPGVMNLVPMSLSLET